jgi:hypothetical protein
VGWWIMREKSEGNKKKKNCKLKLKKELGIKKINNKLGTD